MMTTKYEPGGVSVYPVPIRSGDMVTVSYNGLLDQSGADQVYLYIGYGSTWKDNQFLRMQKVRNGWEKTFRVNHADNLNFCFKDSANNWDNNYGQNWSYRIHH